jgi:hypothetical protein
VAAVDVMNALVGGSIDGSAPAGAGAAVVASASPAVAGAANGAAGARGARAMR